jgi:hypothetical protein
MFREGELLERLQGCGFTFDETRINVDRSRDRALEFPYYSTFWLAIKCVRAVLWNGMRRGHDTCTAACAGRHSPSGTVTPSLAAGTKWCSPAPTERVGALLAETAPVVVVEAQALVVQARARARARVLALLMLLRAWVVTTKS